MVDLETTILKNKFALTQYGYPLVEGNFANPILGTIARSDGSSIECGLIIGDESEQKYSTFGIKIPNSLRIYARNNSFQAGEQDWRVQKVGYGGDEIEISTIKIISAEQAMATTVNVRRLHSPAAGVLIYEQGQASTILEYLNLRRVPDHAVRRATGSLCLSPLMVHLYSRMAEAPITISEAPDRTMHISYPPATYHVGVGYPEADTTIGTVTLPERQVNVSRIPVHLKYIGGTPTGVAREIFEKVIE